MDQTGTTAPDRSARTPANGPRLAQSEYDALADLFLSPTHPSASPGARATPSATVAAAQTQASLAGAPSNVTGGASAGSTAPSTLRMPAHTELKPMPRPSPESERVARVEALVLGHLPVLGGAWVAQYAKHAASEDAAPVALLRMHADQVTLDVVNPGFAARDTTTFDTLEGAVAHAGAMCARWLLRVDDLREPTLVCTPGIDRVTLLTGGDDAALVALYRSIKGLATAQDEAAERDAAPSRRASLTVAVMGSDPSRAAGVEAKLRRAAQTFLQTPIDDIVQIERIGPGVLHTLYRAEAAPALEDVLDMIARATQPGSHPPPGRDAAGPRHLRTVRSDPQPTETSVRAGEAGEGESLSEVTESFDAGAAREPSREPMRGLEREPLRSTAPQVEPAALRMDGASASSSAGAGAGAHAGTSAGARIAGHPAHLIAGLSPLPLRSPYTPSVHAAVDSAGRLHLLACTNDDGLARVDDLLAFVAWATAHAPLISAAFPQLRGELEQLSGQPVLHVITDHAPSVRGLLDTAVRVHLITPVQTGSGTVLACAPLN